MTAVIIKAFTTVTVSATWLWIEGLQFEARQLFVMVKVNFLSLLFHAQLIVSAKVVIPTKSSIKPTKG